MKKAASLKEIVSLSRRLRERGKKVGLILGSFDILHMGHINLFRLAKKHVDFLIVGLDNDQTITKTKGKKRPINNYKRRSDFLSEISFVDRIFRLRKTFKHGDEDSFKYIRKLFKSIKPTHVFTSIKCDGLWERKKAIAESLGINFIPEKTFVLHTSDILKILESEL